MARGCDGRVAGGCDGSAPQSARASTAPTQDGSLTTDEWESLGGWDGVLERGWTVERPDWWTLGSTSGVTAATVEEARVRLDEWQDEMAGRADQDG